MGEEDGKAWWVGDGKAWGWEMARHREWFRRRRGMGDRLADVTCWSGAWAS